MRRSAAKAATTHAVSLRLYRAYRRWRAKGWLALPMSAGIVLAFNAFADAPIECKSVVGVVELYAALEKDLYFAHGVPPPGKEMRVEREACGYKVYVGIGSPESFAGDPLLVDSEGRVTQVISRDVTSVLSQVANYSSGRTAATVCATIVRRSAAAA